MSARGARVAPVERAPAEERTAPPEPWRVLQVDREACPEVVDAAFRVLREQACRDDGPDAPRRLAELTRAHRALRGQASAGG